MEVRTAERLLCTDDDIIIIGAGLGGLSAAAASAREGLRTLVLERRDRAGGYASSLEMPGGFRCDLSLRAVAVGEKGHLPGFPELDLAFTRPSSLCRAVFPEHDLTVPQADLFGYIGLLTEQFPEEGEGLMGLAACVQTGLHGFEQASWAALMDAFLRDDRLKAILSTLWYYFVLPPSEMSARLYAWSSFNYLAKGGAYVEGGSQAVSDAFVRFIETQGGTVELNAGVAEILTEDGTVLGVRTEDGREYRASAVISNASPHVTLGLLPEEADRLASYAADVARRSPSHSALQIYAGLDRDLVGALDITDGQVMLEPTYDLESSFEAALAGDVERCGLLVTLYDNLAPGFSPAGKNTISIAVVQDCARWARLAEDPEAYAAECERLTTGVLRRLDAELLPGLLDALQTYRAVTPHDMGVLTGSPGGAIYGWSLTPDLDALPYETPIKGLYLAGAWVAPGPGEIGVILGGQRCAAQVMDDALVPVG